MPILARSLAPVLDDHLRRYRQMAFVSGPRQVGKTTLCRALAPDAHYVNWDDAADRRTVLAGPQALASAARLDELSGSPRVIVLDLPFVAADCLAAGRSTVVPARTFLSQLP